MDYSDLKELNKKLTQMSNESHSVKVNVDVDEAKNEIKNKKA